MPKEERETIVYGLRGICPLKSESILVHANYVTMEVISFKLLLSCL